MLDNETMLERDLEPSRSELFTSRLYGEAALPKGSPAWLAAAVEEQVKFAQRLPGVAEWTIGQAGGGSLGLKTKEERAAEIKEKELVAFRDAVEETQQQERERWAEEMHSFSNVKMSGAEWSQLGDDLHHDTEMRRWLVERLRQDGRSETDANKKANEIADVATIMGKPEGQRTAEERSKLDRAKSDPTITRMMDAVNGQRLSGHDRLEPTAAAQASREISTAARDDIISTDHDARDRLASANPSPVAISPATPMPKASAGLAL